MGSGQVVHVIGLAAGGLFAVEVVAIPGRRPYLKRLGLGGLLYDDLLIEGSGISEFLCFGCCWTLSWLAPEPLPS